MHSTFNTLSGIIQRRTMQLYHHVSGKGVEHGVNMSACLRTLDAYALERLKAGVGIGVVATEINKVFTAMTDNNGFKRMVTAVDGRYVMTACGLLSKEFRLDMHESRLALFLLQLSTKRELIVQVVETTVDTVEEVQAA